MPLLIVALVALVFILPIVLLPLSIVQRYRVGTARRPARAWVATLNTIGFAVSTMGLVVSATFMSIWVPGALSGAAAGLVGGVALGLIGLSLSHWESEAGVMHFTPNRWLVGVLTLLVVARVCYGFWRAYSAWGAWGATSGWAANAGLAGSLAAGAVLIGYGAGFWAAVRWRIARRQSARMRYV
ncbi:MAG TPA: hypothetical protein VMF13_01100 [Luteitalea sp.]|nr:hypothetical protein [Luteitalea sp.]